MQPAATSCSWLQPTRPMEDLRARRLAVLFMSAGAAIGSGVWCWLGRAAAVVQQPSRCDEAELWTTPWRRDWKTQLQAAQLRLLLAAVVTEGSVGLSDDIAWLVARHLQSRSPVVFERGSQGIELAGQRATQTAAGRPWARANGIYLTSCGAVCEGAPMSSGRHYAEVTFSSAPEGQQRAGGIGLLPNDHQHNLMFFGVAPVGISLSTSRIEPSVAWGLLIHAGYGMVLLPRAHNPGAVLEQADQGEGAADEEDLLHLGDLGRRRIWRLPRQVVFRPGVPIGILLDFETNAVSIYLGGRRLGGFCQLSPPLAPPVRRPHAEVDRGGGDTPTAPAEEEQRQQQCWLVSLFEVGDSARIEMKPPPPVESVLGWDVHLAHPAFFPVALARLWIGFLQHGAKSAAIVLTPTWNSGLLETESCVCLPTSDVYYHLTQWSV